jgi:chemotaxis protein MotB
VADKKAQIVIKKITVVAGGAHGGAWKVAFADFMTAMMAFFLVMWLMATQSEPQKKAISDYFSTPSVIEYNFQNFGAELTLEKLFLDLINEPLKTLDTMFTPMDHNPNVMAMGMKKVVVAYMAEQLGGIASNVNVTADSVVFDIPDQVLFEPGTASPTAQFVSVMEKVKGVTTGLEDSEIMISSLVYNQSVENSDPALAKNISEERLAILQTKVQASLEHDSVEVRGRSVAKRDERSGHDKRVSNGFIRIEIKQKKVLPDGKKPKPLNDTVFSSSKADADVYNNFVNQLSQGKKRDPQGGSAPRAARSQPRPSGNE